MPLPLAIPFIIKGGLVAAKFIASKHAAVTAAKTASLAVKTYGTAATVGAVTQGLVLIGGVAWTLERLSMGRKALQLFDSGDLLGAANELTRIGRSFFQVEGSDFVDSINAWVAHGASIGDPAFGRLVSALRQIVDEANTTNGYLKKVT
jgi:hypothetical protein